MGFETGKQEEREKDLSGTAGGQLFEIQENLALAENNIEELKDEYPEAAARWQRMAELYRGRLELFWAEHDNAGAFKMKKFDRELREMFGDGRARDAKVIETAPDGSFRLAEGEERRRVMFVDMLELDRLNKEGGGHHAGDAGLAATVEAIKQAAAERTLGGKKAYGYEIFRSGGNQFMVSFEDISEEDFRAVMAELSARRVDVSKAAGKTIEGAPLAVTGIDLKAVVEDINLIQAEAGAPFEPGDEAAREMMQIMLRAGDWGGEVRKFAARANRVREKLEAGAPDAKGFFDTYLSKVMKGTGLDSLEAFRQALGGGTFERSVQDASLAAARGRFELDRKFQEAEGRSVDERIRAEIIRSRVEARKRSSQDQASSLQETPPGPYAQIPKLTRGQEIIRGARAAAEEARHALEAAQNARADQDTLFELSTRAENAKIVADIETARRNAGTGLLERGVYYEDLEAALGEGKAVTSVFIDMAFLKYFDQKGGTEVGNEALKGAAHLIENALTEAGLKGEAYRYGGDEFTVLFEGTKDDAGRFTKALSNLRDALGRIAPGPKSSPEYQPTALQFNYGVADTSELDVTLEASGRRPAEANQKADLLTKIADTRVEYMKAVSRFDYLLREMTDEGYHGVRYDLGEQGPLDLATGALESKIEYSRKAIFAEKGGEAVLRIQAARLKEAKPEDRARIMEEVEDEVRRFVMDEVESARKAETAQKRLLDSVLEARTKIGFLEDERDRLTTQYEKEHKRVQETEAELQKARKDFDDLKNTRESLAA